MMLDYKVRNDDTDLLGDRKKMKELFWLTTKG